MSDTNTKTWRNIHLFPLTKAQQKLLDHWKRCRALHPIKRDAEVIE